MACETTVETFTAAIYIAGDASAATTAMRRECDREGLCVTIEKCNFVYTGGSEFGVKIGMVNYPRFPDKKQRLKSRAISIAKRLTRELYQKTALVVFPDQTVFVRRNIRAAR